MNHMEELLKRGLSHERASMVVEHIHHSCVLDGATPPKTAKDYDMLVRMVNKSMTTKEFEKGTDVK